LEEVAQIMYKHVSTCENDKKKKRKKRIHSQLENCKKSALLMPWWVDTEWEGGRGGERAWEGEYSTYTVYT
jgi:hypothetical protein